MNKDNITNLVCLECNEFTCAKCRIDNSDIIEYNCNDCEVCDEHCIDFDAMQSDIVSECSEENE